MKKEDKLLFESIALRYLDLAGIGLNEEIEDPESLSEPVLDAFAGGENLVNPIEQAKVVSDEENVDSVEILDPISGEVTESEISVEKIEEIVRKVRSLVESRKTNS